MTKKTKSFLLDRVANLQLIVEYAKTHNDADFMAAYNVTKDEAIKNQIEALKIFIVDME